MLFARSGFRLGLSVGLCLWMAGAGARPFTPFGAETRASEMRMQGVRAPAAALRSLGATQSSTSKAPALNWGWGNPLPSGDLFEAVAYGNGVYVAAGTGATLYSSTDATHWTQRVSGLPAGFAYFDVYYANGLFLAAGTDSQLVTHVTTSPDGVTWTDHVPALGTDEIADHIGFGNGTYLMVNSVALTSSDGVTWHEHAIESAANHPFFDSPAYANGTFVTMGFDATANNVLYYSADAGVTWHHAATNIPNTDFMLSLASNGHGFVLTGIDETFLGPQAGVVYTSSDGNTWTRQALAGDGDGFFYPTLWDGQHYVTVSEAFGAGGSGPANIYTSTDGVSWAKGAPAVLAPGFAGAHHPIVWTGAGYLATDVQALQLQSSADYTRWAQKFKGSSGPGDNFGAVAFLDGHYLAAAPAIAGTAQAIMESADGIHWSQAFRGSAIQRLGSFAFGNGTYVVVGDAGTGYTSTDGKHWSAMLTPPTINLFGLAYGGGKFVGVGFGQVATSTDGKTWVTHNLSSITADAVTGVVYTGDRFVAVSDDFFNDGVYVITSTDGVIWARGSFTPPAGTVLFTLRLCDGRLLALGALSNVSGIQAYVATSADGLSWSGAATGLFGIRFADVTFDGSRYYATLGSGVSGTLYTSSDAKTWDTLDGVPLTAQANAIVNNDGRFVTAGDGGDLLAAEATAPTAADGTLSASPGTAATGTLAGSSPSGSPLSFAILSGPVHGKLTLSDAATGAFRYTPDAGFTGKDKFTFQVSDGIASSAPATENINVDQGGGGGGGGAFGLLLLAGLLGAAAARRR